MRVTFHKNIKTMSGRCKDGKMVFNAVKNQTICIARRFVTPRMTVHNESAGRKLKAAALIWRLVHANFKSDCEVYANAYNNQHLPENKLPLSGYNIFIKALCQHNLPFDDLNDVSNAFGETLTDWISMGFLKSVNTNYVFMASALTG